MNRVAAPETKNSRVSPPGIGDQHQRLQRRHRMRRLHVEVPRHVEHADVIKDQQEEGADADPVEVGATVGSGRG